MTETRQTVIDVRDLAIGVQETWAASQQPEAVLKAVGQAFSRIPGYRLYTVTRVLPGGGEVERIYSTNMKAYPIGGRKPVLPNAYSQRVRREKKPFLARTPDGFSPFFPDHQTITSLGLGCVMNLPIIFADAVLGTVNLLDAEGVYDESHVEPAMLIARQILPALLEWKS